MFDRRTLAACCALTLPYGFCLAQTTFSAEQYFDDRWYITPFGSYVHPDGDRNADNGWGGGLAVGKPISPSWNIELRGQYEELDGKFGTGFGAFNSTDKYKNWSGTLDAQWFFLGRQGINRWQSNSVHPYLVGGIGAIDNKIESLTGNTSKSSFMANAGLGIVWPFSSWGRLVADARYRYVDNANNSRLGGRQSMNDWLFSVGLQIPFGAAPRVAQAAPPPAPPAAMPPPPPPPPPAVRNFELKADGTFAFAKSDLTPAGRTRIENTLKELRASGIRLREISIVGHTDPIGSAEFNQRLSVARANSVRDYLVSQGVPANIIRAEGRGFNELKVTEADCRAQGKARNRTALIACFEPNRRVDIRATGEQGG
ncbi:OmpA family protein [Variovorax saccharolyticus]|uniref:OmpA family protein n=2 Tax=Variovorax saccharolyticus TaxID=3053516 RepID=UPI0025772874|nr:OmpA family protein [Variovorax sp. J31P216]MDM0028298.1 OmpA family protein [Variovorax sp. J31P216]